MFTASILTGLIIHFFIYTLRIELQRRQIESQHRQIIKDKLLDEFNSVSPMLNDCTYHIYGQDSDSQMYIYNTHGMRIGKLFFKGSTWLPENRKFKEILLKLNKKTINSMEELHEEC